MGTPDNSPPTAAESVFRGRPVRPLQFGTSGLRGLVTDITDLEAYVNTRGYLDALREAGKLEPRTPVAIAGDLRPSTDGPQRSIMSAVARAIVDAGHPVVNCGKIPTPALIAYAMSRGWPSVMVTGSHIPFDRNGIKFAKPEGELLKEDEVPVLRSVARVRETEYARPSQESAFDDQGMFRHRSNALPAPSPEAREQYVRRYVDFFPAAALAGLRAVFFEHSAVGATLVVEILRALGAEVVTLGASKEFVAIDTEAISDLSLQAMQGMVDDAVRQVGEVHALLSTDGDSDRPLFLDVDSRGQAHFRAGDLLGMVVADYLAAEALAVPVTATDALERHFAARGVRIARTRVGSPYVVAAAHELGRARAVGWEANGGFFTFTDIERHGRRLVALPTRDAVLPLLGALHHAKERGAPVGDAFERLPARFGASALLDGVPPEQGLALVARLSPRVHGAVTVSLRGGVQASDHAGRAVPVDEDGARELERIRAYVGRQLGSAQGFGALAELNTMDGIRLSFEGGDVVHLRQSGNAPQLRIYALSDRQARAKELVEDGVREPEGLLRRLLADGESDRFLSAIRRNIAATDRLFETGESPGLVGIVSGSPTAQSFWHGVLASSGAFRPRQVISQCEDLPVNQAFGLLLMWQRLAGEMRPGEGALMAFAFGEGTRATPFTEADSGQKAAMASFVPDRRAPDGRFLTVCELALRYFSTVESYLRRSGFDGVVVKWGDEVQIPTCDLSGTSETFRDADVVRFVSLQPMTADSAASKDWLAVRPDGHVAMFVPRRPLEEMNELAAKGLLERRGDQLWGGINLGSVALSRAFLEVLLEEFQSEVNDPSAERNRRPDWDPQLFTALIHATDPDADAGQRSFDEAAAKSPMLRRLSDDLPGVLSRLRRVLSRFESQHGRAVRIVALDFGDQYWGDIGQHRAIFEFYAALNAPGPSGEVARALAGLPSTRDANGNILAGGTRLGAARARNSVLVGCDIDSGEIVDSVLIGTRAAHLVARGSVDVGSAVRSLTLAERAGSYKLLSEEPVSLGPLERATTVSMPRGEILLRVREDTDLRKREETYDLPILGNAVSFREAHAVMSRADAAELATRRAAKIAAIFPASRR